MISFEDVVEIHKLLIESTGGSHGLRDEGLLKSALARPSASYDGEEFHRSIEDKIAVLCYSLISNHSFLDGNKRIGVTVLLVLAKAHDIQLKYKQEALVKLGMMVASGKWKDEEILKWIQKYRVN